MTGVDHEPLKIRLLYHRFQHLFPDSLVPPTAKTSLDGIPLAIFRRQVSPWRTCPQNPEHAVQKLPRILGVSAPRPLVPDCVRLEHFPHRIGHIVPSIALLHENTPVCFPSLYHKTEHLSTVSNFDWTKQIELCIIKCVSVFRT